VARSRALLSAGWALLAAAFPLSFFDASTRCLPLVAAAAAARLLIWALRYDGPAALVGGLVASLCAYNTSPALFRSAALFVRDRFAAATAIPPGSPALASFGDLGFVALVAVFLALLARRGASERLRRLTGWFAAAHGVLTVALSLHDAHAARLFLPAAAAAFGAALFTTRRLEWVPAAAAALGAASLAYGDYGAAGFRMLGVLALLALLISERLERLLLGLSREAGGLPPLPSRVQLAVLAPLVFLAAGAGGEGWVRVVSGQTGSGLELVLAGAAAFVLACRVESAPLAAIAVLPCSAGLHALAVRVSAGGTSAEAVALPAVSLTLFCASVLAARWCETAEAAARPALVASASGVGTLTHGAFGLLWLVGSATGAARLALLDVRPLVLLAASAAFLDRGLRRRSSFELTAGTALLAAWLPVQLWAAIESPTLALALSGTVLGAVLLLAERSARHEICLLCRSAERVASAWLVVAAAACLVASGWRAVVLASLLAALAWRTARDSRRFLAALLLLFVQVAVALHGDASGILAADLLSGGPTLAPFLVSAALAWHLLYGAAGGRESEGLAALSMGVGVLVAATYALLFASASPLGALAHATLVACALAYAAWNGARAWSARETSAAWLLQGSLGLAVLDAFTAGWLHLGRGLSPFLLLAAGALAYAAARLIARTDRREVFAAPLLTTAHLLPLVGGALSVVRAAASDPDSVWLRALPAFLVSAFYVVVASREERRAPAAVLGSAFLAAALAAAVHVLPFLGPEFHTLAPGFALLLLSSVLKEEMGPIWTRRVFAAGATLVYSTPVLLLSKELAWAPLAALLALAIGFGASSFALRSRALLTVSTAAMVVDLGCLLLKVRETEPMALWVAGAAAGLALMGVAGWLEWRREGVLQRVRVFARELESWTA
jgi:hypothetical protein